MAIEQRIESLKANHATLEQTLREEFCRPHPDDEIIRSLKREKLRIKDEISRLKPQS